MHRAGFLHELPMMVTGGHKVCTPEQDQAAFRDLFRVEAHRVPFSGQQAHWCAAHFPVEVGCAQTVKDPPQRLALHGSHRPEVVQRGKSIRPMLIDDLTETPCDCVKRVFPTHAFESPTALRSSAAQGMQEPIGRIDARLVIVDFCTEHTARDRMRAGT